jgi:hypothetical protein
MLIKNLLDEDFVQYRLPTMTIVTARCSFKCDVLNGCPVCQNSALAKMPDIDVTNDELIGRYLANPITKGICFSGLEPLDQFSELITFIKDFREVCDDLIIIYTGYTDSEARITGQRQLLASFPNIIVKWGRFIMNQPHHTDPILGVELASPNQYAERIS